MPQCTNCQFQNMPGLTHCSRCGALLALREAVINVHPPRASLRAKAWRKSFVARSLRSVTQSARSTGRQWRRTAGLELPAAGLLVRLVVPGWPQIAAGAPALGRCLLVGYGSLILAALLCFGSVLCSFLLGCALSVHGISVYNVARQSSPDLRVGVSRALLGLGMLAACLYLPGYSLATHFVDAVVIQQDWPPLLAGDVLLLRRFTRGRSVPRLGDVVQYQIVNDRVAGQTPRGIAAIYQLQGARIDRVLAGPGQMIRWENRQLIVDGQPSPWLPLNPGGVLQPLQFTVPPDSWLILPSTEFYNTQYRPAENDWEVWGSVRTGQIEGRIFWRSWPWSRIGSMGG